MRFDGKSPPPLVLILTARHICLVLISPLGELTSMVCFMVAIGRLYFATKHDDMNECDAQSQTKLLQDVSLQETYPISCPGLVELPR
jgi:hypothetical protein